MQQKLYRNDHDKMIGGVCSGLADYLKIEVSVLRVLLVIVTVILVASPILAYIILWVVLPVNPNRFQRFDHYFNSGNNPSGMPNDHSNFNKAGTDDFNKWNAANFNYNQNPLGEEFQYKKSDSTKRVFGAVLLIIGLLLLVNQLDIIPRWFDMFDLWPVALIVIGLCFFIKSKEDKDWENFKNANGADATEADTFKNKEDDSQINSNVKPD